MEGKEDVDMYNRTDLEQFSDLRGKTGNTSRCERDEPNER